MKLYFSVFLVSVFTYFIKYSIHKTLLIDNAITNKVTTIPNPIERF